MIGSRNSEYAIMFDSMGSLDVFNKSQGSSYLSTVIILYFGMIVSYNQMYINSKFYLLYDPNLVQLQKLTVLRIESRRNQVCSHEKLRHHKAWFVLLLVFFLIEFLSALCNFFWHWHIRVDFHAYLLNSITDLIGVCLSLWIQRRLIGRDLL